MLDLPGDVTTNDSVISLIGTGSALVSGGANALSDLTSNEPGASISISHGAALSAGVLANAGVVEGSGTVTTSELTNSGSVTPIDNGPATIDISGDYAQTPAGTLQVEFNGTGTTQYSQLAVAGTATLDGTLAISTGFTPTIGDTFTLLTSTSYTGEFSGLYWSGLPSGLAYSLDYSNATQVVVTVIANPNNTPDAPTNVVASLATGGVSVSWTAPTTDGGSPIVGYAITPFVGTTAKQPFIFNSTGTSQTLSSLAGNTTYTFTVTAFTVNGPGTASVQSAPPVSTPPVGTPEAPSALLFPAAAILAAAGVFLVRRRRRSRVSA
jgi:hypothetical protein